VFYFATLSILCGLLFNSRESFSLQSVPFTGTLAQSVMLVLTGRLTLTNQSLSLSDVFGKLLMKLVDVQG